VRDPKRLGDPGMGDAVRPNGDRPIIMGWEDVRVRAFISEW
jgi:hypothetical protein